MKVLALETAGLTGSVAALEGEEPREEVVLDPAQRTARTLAPAVREVLHTVGWRPDDVDLIAVAAGPGSFTGLRLGVTTAKTLAYAAGAEVLGVNTLQVIAAGAPPECRPLEVVLNAQRGQVFVARFEQEQSEETLLQTSEKTRIIDVDAWLGTPSAGTWVSGPMLAKLRDRLPDGVQVVDSALWQPTAATVGRVAVAQYQAGRRDDLWRLVPAYHRPSAAEEKLGPA